MRVMLLHSDGRIRGDFQGAWDNPTGDTFAAVVPDVQHDQLWQIYIYNVHLRHSLLPALPPSSTRCRRPMHMAKQWRWRFQSA